MIFGQGSLELKKDAPHIRDRFAMSADDVKGIGHCLLHICTIDEKGSLELETRAPYISNRYSERANGVTGIGLLPLHICANSEKDSWNSKLAPHK